MDRKKKRYSVPDEAFCATPPYMPDAAYLQGEMLAPRPSMLAPVLKVLIELVAIGGNRPFYQPTPAPNTVVIHDTPTRSKNACCLGW